MKRWTMFVVVFVLMSQLSWAARTQVHDAAESPEYGTKAGGMLGRGLLNVVTCFVDVIVNVVNETKAGPPFVGTLTGVAKGVGCGVLRLGSGAVDVVTFWVPGFNGFPVSDSYEDCLGGMSSAAAPYQEPTAPAWSMPVEEPKATPEPSVKTAPKEKEKTPRYVK